MPSQIILFSHPRTASHLLERLLSRQPRTHYLRHPFTIAREAYTDVIITETDDQDVASTLHAKYLEAIDEGIKTWTAALQTAQAKNEALFVHSHPHFALDPDTALEFVNKGGATTTKQSLPMPNPTLLPESILLNSPTIPIFTIRNPLRMVPSIYNAEAKLLPTVDRRLITGDSNLEWTRRLYDWYKSKGISPIIVDTDDILASEKFVRNLCSAAGLDPNHALFSWDRSKEEDITAMNPAIAFLTGDLLRSEGIQPGHEAVGLNLADEQEKWRQRFGDATMKMITELVMATTPAYEYLYERRLQLPVTD